MYLSVIIPARNEEKYIKGTVESVFDFCSKKDFDFEIIVVANKSLDHTVSIIEELQKTIPQLKLLNYPNQGGKGFAVREGMLHAQGDYRLFMDSDNSTTIDHLDKMMPYFKEGYDVVIASIAISGAQVLSGSEPFWRKLFGKMGNLYTQIVLLPGISDTQRGFKVLSARAVNDTFPIMRIIKFGFDMELLALAKKFGYKIKEVPVRWQNDPNTMSHPRLSSYVEVLRDTLKIRWWLLTGQYTRATLLAEAKQS